jgi:predicted nucleic acid-binding protein
VTFEQVVKVQFEAEEILSGREYEDDSPHVFELVRDSDCSACDLEFIALAIQLGARTATADKNLLKVFPEYTVRLPAARRPQ